MWHHRDDFIYNINSFFFPKNVIIIYKGNESLIYKKSRNMKKLEISFAREQFQPRKASKKLKKKLIVTTEFQRLF